MDVCECPRHRGNQEAKIQHANEPRTFEPAPQAFENELFFVVSGRCNLKSAAAAPAIEKTICSGAASWCASILRFLALGNWFRSTLRYSIRRNRT